jgi:hypothetical protein
LFIFVRTDDEEVPEMPELEVGMMGADQGEPLDEAQAEDAAADRGEPDLAEPDLAEPDLAEPDQAEPDQAVATTLADIAGSVSQLAASAGQYHERARQREGVIEYLRSELDLLRRGERRSLQRPLLTTLSRLHADLLLQARSLDESRTVEQARELLESFAETVETALADAGIRAFAPEAGEPFDPRRQRKVKSDPTPDPALDGLVAAVRKPGYLDIEADSLLAPAEVTLYKTVKDEHAGETA